LRSIIRAVGIYFSLRELAMIRHPVSCS